MEADRFDRRPAARARILGLIVAALSPFLLAFVPPAEKVLDQYLTKAPHGPARFRVTWNGVSGTLDVVGPGAHRFRADSGQETRDPGPGAPSSDGLQSLWRLLDFYAGMDRQKLLEVMGRAGIDIGRRGLARLDPEADAVAVTLGAGGEGQPDLPQAWFDRDTRRLVLVRMGDGSEAVAGPPASNGWPEWIRMGRAGTLEIPRGSLSDSPPLTVPMERYARIAVCLPVAGAFHFRVPPHLVPHAAPGVRAAVPFGGRRAVGFVLSLEETCPVEAARVRDLEDILDPEPVLPPDLLDLGRWLSAYYHHPIGETLAGMIPPAGRASSPGGLRGRRGGRRGGCRGGGTAGAFLRCGRSPPKNPAASAPGGVREARRPRRPGRALRGGRRAAAVARGGAWRNAGREVVLPRRGRARPRRTGG